MSDAVEHQVQAHLDQGWISVECAWHDDCEWEKARRALGTPDLMETVRGAAELPCLVRELRDDNGESTWEFVVVGR